MEWTSSFVHAAAAGYSEYRSGRLHILPSCIYVKLRFSVMCFFGACDLYLDYQWADSLLCLSTHLLLVLLQML